MGQVRRTSLADQAADLLLRRIRAGEWPLGAKLPGETTLGPQLGVGRSTVREAIRQLAGRGVLQTRQGAGVFITALDISEDWSEVLHRAEIGSVLETRMAIESEAARRAAERRSPQALRSMRRTLADRDAARTDVTAYVDADLRFHRSVVAAADNPVLLELFDGLVPRIRSAMIEMLRAGWSLDDQADRSAHGQLVDAIGRRDSDTAGRLSRAHLESLLDAFGEDRTGR